MLESDAHGEKDDEGIELDDKSNLVERRPLLQTPSIRNTISTYYSIVYADFTTAFKYVISDAKKHKKSFLIGIATVFMVVMFVSMLQNIIEKSPIVFLKLSEDEVGEFDMVMTSQNIFINYTKTEQFLSPVETVEGLAPRWLSIAKLIPYENTQSNSSVVLIAIDSVLEKKIGIGRAWKHRPLKVGEMHVTSSVLRRMDVLPNTNTNVTLNLDFLGFMQNMGGGITPASMIISSLEAATGFNFSQNITVGNLATQIPIIVGNPYVNVSQFLNNLIGPDSYDLATGTIYPLPAFNFFYGNFLQSMVINTPMTVVDGIDTPDGKFPKALGNVAVIESTELELLIRTALKTATSAVRGNLTNLEVIAELLQSVGLPGLENFTESVLNVLDQIDSLESTTALNDYAPMIIVMNKHRLEAYTHSQAQMDEGMISFTNAVAEGVGIDYPIDTQLPIAETMTQFQFTKVSLDQIFNCVACVMLALGGMLIYSLLLNDVEAKTYEYGMLRGLGMRQYVLIELLLTQAVYFSIPGIILGLLFGWLLYVFVAIFIADFVTLPVDSTFANSAIYTSVLLGFFMPVVANIFPIRRALTHTLRDALDVYHQVRNETSVSIIRLEKLGLDPWQLILAFCAVFFGFIIYYMVPYAFIYRDYALFFVIMSGILLGMLFGLALIAQVAQPFAERLALNLIMWGWDRRSLSSIVRKNLFAHYSRNIKTAIMFTVSLTFVIFAGTVFRLQGHSIAELVQLGVGGDLWVYSPSASSALPEQALRNYLNSDMLYNPHTVVLGFTFITYPLAGTNLVSRTRLSNLADYPDIPVRIMGVEENFLRTAYDRFYNPTEYYEGFSYSKVDGKPDVVKSLYVNEGKQLLPMEEHGIIVPPEILSANNSVGDRNNITHFDNTVAYTNYVDVIISEAMRVTASVDVNTPMRLKMNFDGNVSWAQVIYLAKARALVNRAPAFFFSSYSLAAYFSPVLVSMNTYQRFLNQSAAFDRNGDIDTVPPKQVLIVKTKESATLIEREGVINGIRNYLADDTILVQNTQDLVESTAVAVNILDVFFYTVAAIAVVLCFFVLWLSFTANVNENSWEFGVLRSLGLTSFQVIRVYVYEALAIIIASVLLGSAIGLMVSLTLTLQFGLFTELPFWFEFPTGLFFGVLLMSVAVAFAGSYFPARAFKGKAISAVLKGQ